MSMGDRQLMAKVLWNLRGLGLFLIGPVLGVLLVAAIFGLPPGLQVVAGIMFAFSLGIYAMLIRGEWRRLSGSR